jgi:hypothetical protein
MDMQVQREIRLASSYGDSLPPIVVAQTLHAIVPAARSATFMAIEGRGRLGSGRPPKWATDVADIRFRDAIPVQNVMVLRFVVPRLGQAAPHLYEQRDFWRDPPPQDTTSIDLLEAVIRDVAAENRDSDTFDQSVLRDVQRFGKVVESGDISLAFTAPGQSKRPTEITRKTMEHVKALNRVTPIPHQVRIVGTLDMIRASTQGFGLKLDDGSELAGIYEHGGISDLEPLFRKRVVVNGNLVYRPSGRPLRLDATRLRIADGESSLWSRLPGSPVEKFDVGELRQPQTKKSGVGAILGQWPGDEDDKEIGEKLNSLS